MRPSIMAVLPPEETDMEKKRFIRQLGPVVSAAHEDVARLTYRVPAPGVEFVDIIFTDGACRPVNVSRTSNARILKAVVDTLAY